MDKGELGRPTCLLEPNQIFRSCQARAVEKAESFVSSEATPPFDLSRLEYARIDGPGVTLAYMGDDKNYVRSSRRIPGLYPNDSRPPTESPNGVAASVGAPGSDGQYNRRIHVCYHVLLT